ncbi:MAG: ribosomal protein L7/L12 [Saprospiraceae bacterium]
MPIKYYQSYHNYFWQWEDDAEVITIPNGNTIAYRMVILNIVKELSPQGLPPFGALLLSLIALNPNGKEDIESVMKILGKKFGVSEVRLSRDENLHHTFDFLKRLSEIDEKYKSGKRKIILLKAIFEDCHNILSLRESSRIAKLYIDSSQAFLEKKEFATIPRDFHKTITTLGIINQKFPTVESIIEKMIDLPEQNDPIILEEPIESEDLIENFSNDPRTFKVGALVKQIWSGLNLPFHKNTPSQMPIGGVSDLTNKGNFDQLLISEYANDDLTFLSRLANNEALFLNRESPPSSNDLKRVILIDISMRNWGTPKTVAYATMLAIAKHPKSDFECEVFAIGDTVQAVQIESVHDLIEALQKVEATLNSAKGIEEYFKLFPSNKNREVFLITEKSVPLQNEMSKALSDYGEQINYLIFNDSTGQIDIFKKLKNSKKHIQHLEIPLQRLWKKKPKTKIVLRLREKNNFYPILVKPPQENRGVVKTKNGETFLITKDRTLLRYFDKTKNAGTKGWEIIHENLKISSSDFEVGVMNNGEYILLTFNPQNREVRIINLNTKKEKRFYFDQWRKLPKRSFVFHDQSFYHIGFFHGTSTWKIDIEGNIKKFEFDNSDRNMYDKKLKEDLENQTRVHFYHNLLKKLRTVGISENGKLAFNNHELVERQGNHLKLVHNSAIKYVAMAEKIEDNYFQFPDGSTVELINPGLFILKSSDEANYPIYFPSVLNMSNGIANQKCFAGNHYFKNEPLFEINLKNIGDKSKLRVVSTIKQFTGFGLLDCKNIAYEAPRNLLTYFTNLEATEAQNDLMASGAEVELIETNSSFKQQDDIGVPIFFSEYVKPFIQRILNYGT